MMASASWRGRACGSFSQWKRFHIAVSLAVDAVTRLPAHSFLLDGEAIVTNDRGLAVFDLIRHQRHSDDAVLIAFDLIELEGEDLRGMPIEQRKRKLAKLVRGPHPGIVLNEVFEGDGAILFEVPQIDRAGGSRRIDA